MTTLSERAIEKLSVREIWEKGVLDAPLPSQTIDKLYDKITLQNLYQEDLIRTNMDLDLFTLAVSRSVPHLLWSYINHVSGSEPNAGLYSEESPFSEEGERYVMLAEGLTPEEFEKERENARDELLKDLIVFLKNLDVPQRYKDAIYVTSEMEDGLWKLLIIDLSSKLEIMHTIPPTHVFILNSLDEVLNTIYETISTSIEPAFPVTLDGPEGSEPERIDPTLVKSFDAIRLALGYDTEELWDQLTTREITLSEDFQLSLSILKEGARVNVIGDYLYLIILYGHITDYVYYSREDGLALLTSFFLPVNKWSFNDIQE